MAAEAVGLAIGVAGLVAAFKGAIDGYLLVDSYVDKNTDSSYLVLRYHNERQTLAVWGDYFRLNDTGGKLTDGDLHDQPESSKQQIINTLGQVKRIHEQVEVLVNKHFPGGTATPMAMPTQDLRPGNKASQQVARQAQRLKPLSKFTWTIKSEPTFSKYVTQLQHLNDDLWKVLRPSKANLLRQNLPSYSLLGLDDEMVKKLSDPRTQSPRLVVLAAKMKELQQPSTFISGHSPTSISENQLKSITSASTEGLSTAVCERLPPHPGLTPVWVEWYNIPQSLAADRRYTDRIRALAFFLQQVSEPAVCLPPCLGICDDLAFESQHGNKRLGCIFTLPDINVELETNLRGHPPVALRKLISTTSKKPPLLGQRFSLAYKLASAFGLFHAAGWLHKGFHTSNIIFLHKADGPDTLTIENPLITGFQYTRPHNVESLAFSPLQDPQLQYYYHPDATQGFTKKLDLYSLGVVLCEIGRWDLIPESTRRSLSDRSNAREYILHRVVDDLGWRMGSHYQKAVKALLTDTLPGDEDPDFFTQQYFERVLKCLDFCQA